VSARAGIVGIAIVLTALLAWPAAGLAGPRKAVSFGAKLTKHTQPSNAAPPHTCQPNGSKACTRVAMIAYGRNPGGEKAPMDGTIVQIKLIAQVKGSFVIELAEAQPGSQKARIVLRGPKITYKGQGHTGSLDYKIETFAVNMPVSKGQYLAVETTKISALRCDSGGTRQLFFQPPLPEGGSFEKADDDDGCFLLVEAVYG
jgi:hypothetical protein